MAETFEDSKKLAGIGASVEDAQRNVIDTILLWLALPMMPVLAASLLRSQTTGWEPAYTIQAALWVIVSIVYLLRFRFSTLGKALIINVLVFILLASSYGSHGVVSASAPFYVLAIAAISTFNSTWLTLGSFIFLTASIAGPGAIWLSTKDLSEYNSPTSWGALVVSLILVSFFLAATNQIAIGQFARKVAALKKALRAERQAEQELEDLYDQEKDQSSTESNEYGKLPLWPSFRRYLESNPEQHGNTAIYIHVDNIDALYREEGFEASDKLLEILSLKLSHGELKGAEFSQVTTSGLIAITAEVSGRSTKKTCQKLARILQETYTIGETDFLPRIIILASLFYTSPSSMETLPERLEKLALNASRQGQPITVLSEF